MEGNREYRSDVCSLLLSDKSRALELYNALNESDYDDPELVEIVTIKNRGISLSIRNDAAFIVDANLNIYEHESTICPNMPLRELIYFVAIIQERIRRRDIYGKTLVRIPTPHFIVFYNGAEYTPEQYELKLSEAFEHMTGKPELELTCRVYNINRKNNAALMRRSPTLREYMYFIDSVREYHRKNNYTNLADAIRLAISQCIEENILRDVLLEHRSEVVKMMQLDYTFERCLELGREEALEEGLEKGESNIVEVVCAIRAGVTEDELTQKYRHSTIARAKTLLQQLMV